MPALVSRITQSMYTATCPHCKKYDEANVTIKQNEKGEILGIEVQCHRAPDGRQDRT